MADTPKDELSQPKSGTKIIPAFARQFATRAFAILMPPVCLACRQPLASRDTVCAGCWQQITFIRHPLCDRLGIPLPFDTGGTMISAAAQANPPAYRKARAVAGFDGVMRQLIHGFKFSDRLEARILFSRWLSHAGADLIAEADIIAPVPLNRLRLLARRYNQSAILARQITRHQLPDNNTRATFNPHILVRTRATRPQVGLSPNQRKLNVQGAFKVPKSRAKDIQNRNILLIDDVITTGATVNACAHALKKAGASQVDILSLAMVTDTGKSAT